jgi:two-component system, sporulation sensor kinase E
MKTTTEKHWEILLVDDDEEDFLIIHSMLLEYQEPPSDLDWVKNGDKFLELVCSGKYDAALVDHRLGKQNGLELIGKLKLTCPEIPVILITGWPVGDLLNSVQLYGADSFLDKSTLDSGTLHRTIQMVLEKHDDLLDIGDIVD